jgi:hypothetical protein
VHRQGYRARELRCDLRAARRPPSNLSVERSTEIRMLRPNHATLRDGGALGGITHTGRRAAPSTDVNDILPFESRHFRIFLVVLHGPSWINEIKGLRKSAKV